MIESCLSIDYWQPVDIEAQNLVCAKVFSVYLNEHRFLDVGIVGPDSWAYFTWFWNLEFPFIHRLWSMFIDAPFFIPKFRTESLFAESMN